MPQEESQKLPSLSDTALEPDESKPYEVHPLHGALPPHPVDQTIAASSPVYDGQMDRTIHPTYGLLPPRDDHHELTETSVSFSRSDSEPGGQSQPSSMVTNSSYTDSTTTSTQFFSHDSTSSSVSDVNVHKESIEITKLKAKVDDLVLKLEEAEAEIRRKDAKILSMQQQLDRAEREKTSQAGNSYNLHPHHLKLNGSDSPVHTMVTPSGNYAHVHGHTYRSAGSISPNSVDKELGGQPHAEGHGKSFSKKFISRSKSSSPSASISFV